MKGPKAHIGRGLASSPFKPSAEADGKREPAAQSVALSVCSSINHHLSGSHLSKYESDRRKYNFDADFANNTDKKICIRCLIRVIREIRVKNPVYLF